MNLSQIEAQLLKETGRDDLQAASGADRGLRYYINAAQRLLDITVDHPRSIAWYHHTLSENDYHLHIPRALNIFEVWCADDTSGRWKLRLTNLDELRSKEYRAVANQAVGMPEWYALDVIQIAQTMSDRVEVDYTGMYNYQTLDFEANYATQGILFYPKSLSAYTMSVLGKFFHPELADNVAAVGTITVSEDPIVGQTFIIGTQTFTWTAAGVDTGNVIIGGDVAEHCTNIKTSVNRDLSTVVATSTATTVVITAATAGRDGNSIIFANVDSTGLSFDESDEQAGYLGGTTRGDTLDTNFWTEVHPDSLIRATCYKLEEANRNREGMLDALAALDVSLGAIDFQMTKQVMAKGSFMREMF